MCFYKKLRYLVFIVLYLGFLNLFAQENATSIEHFGAGEYPFDTTSGFKICGKKESIYQYYSLRYKYPLNVDSCAKTLNKLFRYDTKINGIITVRFVVNCNGDSGFFHLYEIDNKYRKIKFPEKYKVYILKLVKGLKKWEKFVGKKQDGTIIPIDYYTYFSFRILNGQVNEIIP